MDKEELNGIEGVQGCIKSHEPVWMLIDPTQVGNTPIGLIMRRLEHHVIAGASAEDLANWERLKEAEKPLTEAPK